MEGYDNDVVAMDQDVQRRGRSAQRVPARRGRPPIINRNVPPTIQAAFRTIGSTYERLRELDAENELLRNTNAQLGGENDLLRNTNSDLQQDLFIVKSDLYETQRNLSTVTQERDTAQEELAIFKVTKEEIEDFSLEKLAAGQMATASVHNIFVSELTRRVDDFVSSADFSHSKYVIDSCPVCLDNTNMPNMALVQCGHTVCHSCSQKMEQPFKCPRCRCTSTQMIKLFGMSQV
jgi:hypothetical protein